MSCKLFYFNLKFFIISLFHTSVICDIFKVHPLYTTNPHERLASYGRAATKWKWFRIICRIPPSARQASLSSAEQVLIGILQTTSTNHFRSVTARPLLAEHLWGLVVYQ